MLPPLTLITKLAAASSRSMFNLGYLDPVRASWLFSRRQKAHHWVVYIVTGSDTQPLPSSQFGSDSSTHHTRAGFPFP